MSENKVFWYIKFGEETKCYHSSIFLDKYRGCAVLDPPEESFFKSSLCYNNYRKMTIYLYTNDQIKGMEKYNEYLNYVETFDSDISYKMIMIGIDEKNPAQCLAAFNDIYLAK